jgi:hypothetical protein
LRIKPTPGLPDIDRHLKIVDNFDSLRLSKYKKLPLQ